MDTRPNDLTELKTQALEACLLKIESGYSLEEALKPYGDLQAELRPLVETAAANRAYAASLAAPKSAMTRSRARFLNTATTYAERSPRSWFTGLAFPRLAMAGAAFILVLLVVSLSTAAASAQALPGDLLYPVKLASEQTRLFLAGNPLNRIRLEKTFDERREEEIKELLRHDRSEIVQMGGEVTSIQPGIWVVRNTTVLVDSTTQLEQDIETGFYVEVNGLLQPDGSLLAQNIRARQIHFSGTVDEANPNQWIIDGLSIQVTTSTLWSGLPSPGSRVLVTAFVLADGSLRAYQIQIADSKAAAVTWTSEPFTDDLEQTPEASSEIQPAQNSRSIESSESENSEETQDNSSSSGPSDGSDDEHHDDEKKEDGTGSKESSKNESHPTEEQKPDD